MLNLFRFTSRIYPISNICELNEKNIQDVLKPLIDTIFNNQEDKKPKKVIFVVIEE